MVEFGVGCSDTFSLDKATKLIKNWEEQGATNIAMTDHKIARDAFCVMSICGVLTTKTKLGIIAADPYTRHPAMTASSIATVDEASKGRAFLWLSAGLGGHRELGVKRVAPVVAVRECLEMIKGLLSGNEIDYHGQVLSFNRGRLMMSPRPNIPISIMSRSPKLLELAGELADGVVLGGFSSKESIKYAMESFKTGLKRSGRNSKAVEVTTWVTFTVNKDPKVANSYVMDGLTEKLWSGAKSFLYAAGITIPKGIEKLTSEHEMNKDTIDKCKAMLTENPEFTRELIEHFTISGTVEDCIRKIKYISTSGIDKIFVNPIAPNREIDEIVDVFLREVVPSFS